MTAPASPAPTVRGHGGSPGPALRSQAHARALHGPHHGRRPRHADAVGDSQGPAPGLRQAHGRVGRRRRGRGRCRAGGVRGPAGRRRRRGAARRRPGGRAARGGGHRRRGARRARRGERGARRRPLRGPPARYPRADRRARRRASPSARRRDHAHHRAARPRGLRARRTQRRRRRRADRRDQVHRGGASGRAGDQGDQPRHLRLRCSASVRGPRRGGPRQRRALPDQRPARSSRATARA